MLFQTALLVNATANVISCFMADLQPDRQTGNMAAALSLLPTQGLVNKAIKQIMYAYSIQIGGLCDTKAYLLINNKDKVHVYIMTVSEVSPGPSPADL